MHKCYPSPTSLIVEVFLPQKRWKVSYKQKKAGVNKLTLAFFVFTYEINLMLFFNSIYNNSYIIYHIDITIFNC